MQCHDCPHLNTPGEKRPVCCGDQAAAAPPPTDAAKPGGNRAARRRQSRIAVEAMTPGQLKLSFAATCAFHRCDAAKALAFAGRAPVEVLRRSLAEYRDAMKLGNAVEAEAALMRVVTWQPGSDVPEELREELRA